jgi:LPXTG-motif cell wall-anchored protein
MPRFRTLLLSVLFLSLFAGRAVASDGQDADTRVNVRIEMSAEPEVVAVGDDVTFEYTVINNGDVALTDVTVIDRDLGPIGTVDRLDPGESKSWTRTETVDASSKTRRAVVVDATGPDGQAVHAQRDVSFTVLEATTTTANTPTTAAPTTTTAPPTTTTTAPPQVLGEQVSRPAPELPRTGSPTTRLVLAGLLLLVAGSALRRRGRAART